MKKNTTLKWLLGRVGKQKYALIFACLFSMLQAAGVVWLALNVRNIINVATGFMTEPGDFFTAWIAKLLAFAGSISSNTKVVQRLNERLDEGIEAFMVMDGERGFEKKYSDYKKLKNNPKR